MARVNLFIRSARSHDLDAAKAFNAALGVSPKWTPSSEDFFSALATIEKHDLKYDFKSADDLYLEPYKPLNFLWI